MSRRFCETWESRLHTPFNNTVFRWASDSQQAISSQAAEKPLCDAAALQFAEELPVRIRVPLQRHRKSHQISHAFRRLRGDATQEASFFSKENSTPNFGSGAV
jgi:hypothetical protein